MTIRAPIEFPTDVAPIRAAASEVDALRKKLKGLDGVNKEASRVKIAEIRAAASVEKGLIQSVGRVRVQEARNAGAIDKENARGAARFQLAQQKAIGNVVQNNIKTNSQLRIASAKRASAVELAGIRDVAKARRQQVHLASLAARSSRAAGGAGGVLPPPGAIGAWRRVNTTVGNVGGALRRLGPIAAIAGAALGAAAVGAAVKFAQAAFEMRAFESSARFAFNQLLGSSEKGSAAFEHAIATANKLGLAQNDVLQSTNDLFAAGFDGGEVDNLIKSFADLKTLNPAADLKLIGKAISQIKGKGKLQMEELRGQLADQGLQVSKVIEEIAKSRGVTIAEVEKAITAGEVGSDEGIRAILATINKLGGGQAAGAVAEAAKDSTLRGQVANVKNAFSDFVRSMDIDGGPMKEALAEVVDLLKDPEVRKAATELANAIIKLGGASLKGLARGLKDAAPHVTEMFDALKGEDGQGLERLGNAAGFVAEAFVQLVSAGATFIGWLASASAMATMFGGMMGVGVVGAIEQAKAALDALGEIDLAADGVAIANSFVDGLIEGLIAGLGPVGVAAAKLAKMIPKSSKSELKEASPSKIAIESGLNYGRGNVIGLKKSIPMVASQSAKLAAAVNANSLNTLGGGTFAGLAGMGGGRQSSSNNFTAHFGGLGGITVQGGGADGKELANELGPILEERVMSMIDRAMQSRAAGLGEP